MALLKADVLGQFPMSKEGKTVKIRSKDKIYEWGDIDLGKCTPPCIMEEALELSPFIHRDLPGL